MKILNDVHGIGHAHCSTHCKKKRQISITPRSHEEDHKPNFAALINETSCMSRDIPTAFLRTWIFVR
jgi:hypothetical protein